MGIWGGQGPAVPHVPGLGEGTGERQGTEWACRGYRELTYLSDLVPHLKVPAEQYPRVTETQ